MEPFKGAAVKAPSPEEALSTAPSNNRSPISIIEEALPLADKTCHSSDETVDHSV
jgi:hypothetical protein